MQAHMCCDIITAMEIFKEINVQTKLIFLPALLLFENVMSYRLHPLICIPRPFQSGATLLKDQSPHNQLLESLPTRDPDKPLEFGAYARARPLIPSAVAQALPVF